ncbi:MAG: META domain-containing protein [Bacteroidetes bacterium]|nr:META domain-containing protein [Bacteroidota bacterium]
MSTAIKILFFSLALFVLVSCKNNAMKPFGKDPALEQRKWELVEIGGKKVSLPDGVQKISLEFEGQSNTFGGNSGCNQCNGMYTTHEDMIKLHMMAVTKMACPAMEMENLFLKKMEETTRYELKKVKENKKWVEYLHFYKDLEQVMVLKSTAP